MSQKTKELRFKGSYWWSDSQNVTSLLEIELREILNGVRVGKIIIQGTDFNDGRESRKAEIIVSDNKITVLKNYL